MVNPQTGHWLRLTIFVSCMYIYIYIYFSIFLSLFLSLYILGVPKYIPNIPQKPVVYDLIWYDMIWYNDIKYIYVYIYICIDTYIYIYIYIYTHIWFACQQRVLKTFPSPGYLRSEDGVVWLWHSLVNL